MRKTLAEFLCEDDYLLHADMFNIDRFKTDAKVINCGLGESNLVNVAAGLASEGKTVYIYGVAGFIIHRFEQLKFSAKNFGSKNGKIIICNAGKYGYEKLGEGHALNDDLEIMKTLDIDIYDPINADMFRNILSLLDMKKSGIFYVRLGKDED
jgi:transketolase